MLCSHSGGAYSNVKRACAEHGRPYANMLHALISGPLALHVYRVVVVKTTDEDIMTKPRFATSDPIYVC